MADVSDAATMDRSPEGGTGDLPRPTPSAGAVLGGLDVAPDQSALQKIMGLKGQEIDEKEAIRSKQDASNDRHLRLVEQQYAATGIQPGEFPRWNAEEESRKHSTEPLVAFGSLGSVLGMIASAFTHAPLENAMNASAAAMNAIRAGDQQEYERAHTAWKENTDLAFKRHEMQRQAYHDAIELLNTNMAVGEVKAKQAAARFGDKQALAMMEAGLWEPWIEAQTKQADGFIKLMGAKDALMEKGFRDEYLRQGMKKNESIEDPQERAGANLRLLQDGMWQKGKPDFPMQQLSLKEAESIRTTGKPLTTEQRLAAYKEVAQAMRPNISAATREADIVQQRASEIREANPALSPGESLLQAEKEMTAAKTKPAGSGGSASANAKLTERNEIKEGIRQEHPDWAPDQVNLEADKKSAAAKKGAGAILDDKTANELAEQAIAGDSSVYTNLGRGAQGSENIIKVRTIVAEKLAAQGKSGRDLATANAEYQGLRAAERTAGTREATVGIAAFEAKNMMIIAQEYSDKVPRTQWVPVNKAIQAVEAGASDPDLKAFAAANNALVNGYVRAISPTGVPTDIVRKHAYDTLSTADSKEAYKAVLKLMIAEMDAAIAAPDQMKKQLLGQTTGKETPAAPPNVIRYDAKGNRI